MTGWEALLKLDKMSREAMYGNADGSKILKVSGIAGLLGSTLFVF